MPGQRPAATLVELLLAVSLAGGLMLIMGHIVRQVTTSVAGLERRSQVQTEASLALLRLRSELRQAAQILTVSSTGVSFVHPDIDGGQPDTITYNWSGVPGDPLTRQVGAGSAENILENCQSLVISTAPPPVADEDLLAAHYVHPPGTVFARQEFPLSSANWAAEYFSVPGRSGASSFKVTRVRVEVRRSSTTGSLKVGIYNTLLNDPSTAVEWASRPMRQINSTAGWEDFYFTSATGLALNTGYAVVARCGSGSALITYDQITSGAPLSSLDFYRYSTDSGTVWLPLTNLGARDLRYCVYGRYLNSAGEPLAVLRAPLRLLDVHVQAGAGTALVRLDTTVECINQSEIRP